MPAESLVVRASIFDGFDNFLDKRGVSLKHLLIDVGLEPSALEDPFAEIPLNQVALVMEMAAESSGDPCLGLAWTDEYPTGGLRTFGYIVLNSRTAREALNSVARYIGLLTYPVDVEFKEEDHHGVVSWRWPASLTSPHMQYSSFLVALLVSRLRRALQGNGEPLLVELAHRPLECAERARRLLGSNIEYNAGRYAVHYEGRALDSQFAETDPRLLSIVKPLGEKMLEELRSKGDILVETRTAIFKRLATGDVTLEDIATELDLSPRALQSRLSQVGTTYDALLNETRKAAALRYLRDNDLTLTHIAFLLGYSELSAFTRAAQRWFGVPPSTMRQKLRS